MSAANWSSIRVIVSDEKSGSLKSGQRSVRPCARSRSAKYAAFFDCAEEAKPWR